MECREGLCLGPDIFLFHGHQGRFFEDQAWKLSRWAVKFIWRTIQNIFHIGIDGPAENTEIRQRLELSYYRWARRKKILLICGHTHRAIFASLTRHDILRSSLLREKRLLIEAPTEEEEAVKEKIEKIDGDLEQLPGRESPSRSFETDGELPVPCYFNDGCCVYTNGITCLEIDRGSIRLVKWDRSPQHRRILVEGNLTLLLGHVREGRRLDDLSSVGIVT